MTAIFYLSAVVAVAATVMVIQHTHVIHALLYLVISLLATALVIFVLGAPLIAALEVIIYAGAIMVLFVFVVMMLNLGEQAVRQEEQWISRQGWIGPGLLGLVLVAELFYVFLGDGTRLAAAGQIAPKDVGITLLGTYILGVELASLLLLAGLVGAYHLGRQEPEDCPHVCRHHQASLQDLDRHGGENGTVPLGLVEKGDTPHGRHSV